MAARKTTKKSSPKKSTSQRKTRKPVVSTKRNSSMSSSLPEKDVRDSKAIKTVLVAVLIAVVLYLARGLFVVSIVNGEPIYRLQVVKQLERLGGSQVHDELVQRALVRQEVAKRGLSVTDEDVQAEIQRARDEFSAMGLTLESALEQDGLSLSDLEDLTRYQLELDRLVDKSAVEVTEEEVQAYYDQNKAFMSEEQTFEVMKDQLTDALKEQKAQSQTQDVLDQLLKDADVNTIHEY